MLFYVPLEPYENRYTSQWSAPKTGWLEKKWLQYGVEYTRVDGVCSEIFNPNAGKVLNPIRRTEWSLTQTTRLCQMLATNLIKDRDHIWFDDFWHPGLEQFRYCMDMYAIHPTLASFCHAQSVDKYDFTHSMAPWMRPIEVGYSKIYDYIFVNNHVLQEMMDNINPEYREPSKVRVAGHVFDSDSVFSTIGPPHGEKEDRVVFSSRFDSEKQPNLFLDIVTHIAQSMSPFNVKFVICSGTELKSDVPYVVERARTISRHYPDTLEIRENLTKAEYYRELQRAKVQISTSAQDWISFCLLEAITFGCYPLYPNYRSFPEAFGKYANHLYPIAKHPIDTVEILCEEYLASALVASENSAMMSDMFDEIVKPHDYTWHKILNVMGVEIPSETR